MNQDILFKLQEVVAATPEVVQPQPTAFVTGMNSLILIALCFGVPFLSILICSCFKIKLSDGSKMLLYAFTTGLIVILGGVGFIGEAFENLNHASEENGAMAYLGSYTVITIVKIAIIVSGAIIGVGLIFFVRWLTFKNKKEVHKSHELHGHNDHIVNYTDIDCEDASKKNGLILLLSHRIVDGISLGLLTKGAIEIGHFDSWGMIVTFVVHLIPTTIVVYLTQVDMYKSKGKALLHSFWMLLINLPFVLIGSFFAYGIEKIYWLMPLLFTISGTILIVLSIIEIVPEFIHNKEMQTKKWYIVILVMSLGIVLGLLLLCIHHH